MVRLLATVLALILVTGLGASVGQASTTSGSYGRLEAWLTVPDEADPTLPFDIDVYARLTTGGVLYGSVWLDTTWAYDEKHLAEPVGGVLLASTPGDYVYNAFVMNPEVGPLPPGDHTITLFATMGGPWAPSYSLVLEATVSVGVGVVPVDVDILPGACPNPVPSRARGGMLPVALLGAADFDVATVDPSSVELEGTAAEGWSVDDVSGVDPTDESDCPCPLGVPDGYDDLVLRFDRLSVVAAALADAARGDVVVLTLSAKTWDGVPLEGVDCVVVR